MLQRLFRPIVFLLMLLIFMGSAGWMYTSHFCKMEKSCVEEKNGACCEENDKDCSLSPTLNPGLINLQSSTESCCVNINLYYNFPLYRAFVLETPSLGFSFISVLPDHLLNSTNSLLISLRKDGVKHPPDKYPDLSRKLAVLNVFRV